jgi:Glycosyl hydrolases family 2
MKLFVFLITLTISINIAAQPYSDSFEIRYFTSDTKANGETDFKGETEWMTTDQRITFLNKYADFASEYFNNKDLNKEIVTDNEVDSLMSGLKPQPLPKIRKTIPLVSWKSFGYKKGQDELKIRNIESWTEFPDVSVSEGNLLLNNTTIKIKIDSLTWRFKFECRVKIINTNSCLLTFSDRENPLLSIDVSKGEIVCISETKHIKNQIDKTEWINLIIESDLSQKRFNLYVNDKRLQYYIPMKDNTITAITNLSICSKGKTLIDDIFLINHRPTEEKNYPYISSIVLDENFEDKPDVENWHKINFNDDHWIMADLPAVHGGIREKEENLYLRKKIFVGEFERATLVLETLDPGGEVWVNNEVVSVINNRHPNELDVTKYLIKNKENLIAIRVKPYKLNFPMPHTPTDHHIGWFLGRTSLILSAKCMISNVQVSTKQIGQQAIQQHKIDIHLPHYEHLEGNIEINYYPWFPEEGVQVATFSQKIDIRPHVNNNYSFDCIVPSPNLWSSDSPNLYKVEIILKDNEGNPIDDFVTTTGIRTIEQKNGELLINGKPEMLNGAQIMGFRTPIETIAKYNRCAQPETVAEEMLMIKKLGANLLRVHVHAEKDTTDGINDPRYAEYADQMGIYLIWSTAAFIREGEAWNIDFDGYPKFIRQVYNHPSIVMWEASNHPNKFKLHDISETNDFVKNIYQVIYDADQSRLISPTSFWQHTHYANYNGTKDYQGNTISAVTEFLAPLVTRGSQDAYSGYGNDWTAIRNAPNEWAASCLDAKDKAYFNFEHEESIAQPNWSLSKGKPWYLIQSYEWGYDEGSIGRKLTTDEWRASQAWQAFSAWESMKKQILLGYDGFSWCCLHGGANMGTYQKPLIDNMRHPKLAFYINKMIFQKTWAGSKNVDVVYGPDDKILPIINHLGKEQRVNLTVSLLDLKRNVKDKRIFKKIDLNNGHVISELEAFRFKNVKDGIYFIVYEISETN